MCFGEGPLKGVVQTIKFVTTQGLNEEKMQSYTCLLDETAKMFLVNIGKSSVEGFVKSTFMNVVKLAKCKNATKIYFVVSRDNPDKSAYRKAFKQVDLKRVSTDEKKTIFKKETDSLVYSKEMS
jgi:hypothetical protein